MDISDNIFEIIKWLGSFGLSAWIIRYFITFILSSNIERRQQRQELHHLHKITFFILLCFIVPFMYSYLIKIEFFPKITGSDFEGIFVKFFIYSISLQTINTLLVSFLKLNTTRKIYRFLLFFSLILAAFTSLVYFIFILEIWNTEDDPIKLIVPLISIYFFLYLLYFQGVMKNLNSESLVEVHLKNGGILHNLILSHRSFGKDLIFYDNEDELRRGKVVISKEEILFLVSYEHQSSKEINDSKKAINDFSSKIIKTNSKAENIIPNKRRTKRRR